MSDRRQRIYTVLNKCATMIKETSNPLNSSIDTSNINPLLGVTNICLSSFENPSASKVRLHQLLSQVEKEFEAVLLENIALRKELERYGGLNNNNNNAYVTTTTSRDREVHIWKCSLDENKDDEDEDNEMNTKIIPSPLLALQGDDDLSCANWLQRDQIVETGTSLCTLSEHDEELTYVSCHQTKSLAITSLHDGTFRLWDYRTPRPSVQISNDHTKAMNSTLFLNNDRLVSSSDDAIPLDDSLRSPTAPSFNETNKNGNGTARQNKKQMATNSNITSDKQLQRT
ncbi:unnamed protein product [Adineta steineri]|uniref:WD repeat-containing protein 37 n=1 Tax=Adineta steineri TaxID=433720 RepID=A0A813MQU1_9BILA|nr:unnamed protein product [Adineta steineri]